MFQYSTMVIQSAKNSSLGRNVPLDLVFDVWCLIYYFTSFEGIDVSEFLNRIEPCECECECECNPYHSF